MEPGKKRSSVSVAITAALAAAALLCVCWIVFGLGSERTTDVRAGYKARLGEETSEFITNTVSDVMVGVLPLKKVYTINETAAVAPEPNQALFGETEDPAVIEALVDEASMLLDGQELLWDSGLKLLPESKILYYFDETILSLTWQQVINNSVYTMTEVKLAHPSQFRRYLADDSFGGGMQYKPSELAESVNAVTAISGDFYKNRIFGVVVYKSELYRANGSTVDTCFVDSSGELLLVPAGELVTREQVVDFVSEHDVMFSLCFGPILLKDGGRMVPDNYVLGEINEHYQRAALGRIDELHYLTLTVNKYLKYGLETAQDVMESLESMGVKDAYMIDGGQTAAMIVNDKLINPIEYRAERTISDILYFATAIPEQERKET